MKPKCTQKRLSCCLSALLTAWLLSACGGSGGSGRPSPPPPPPPPVTTDSGRFVDAAVAGLAYESGMTAGVTDGSGRFSYERVGGVAQDVSFSFGNVAIGSAVGKPVLTPVT